MALLILALGLALMLGTHSLRTFAGPWRAVQIQRWGVGRWKGAYSIASLAGLALVIWGFVMARAEPIVLWVVPVWAAHVAGAMTMIAFVLVVSAYVPGNHIKSAVGHPMLAGTIIWALAHLLANGTVAHVLLFGAFLIWASLEFFVSRHRDRLTGARYPAAGMGRDVLAIVAGVLAWAFFAHLGHLWLIGVRPLA